jgi:hypothetical protein
MRAAGRRSRIRRPQNIHASAPLQLLKRAIATAHDGDVTLFKNLLQAEMDKVSGHYKQTWCVFVLFALRVCSCVLARLRRCC